MKQLKVKLIKNSLDLFIGSTHLIKQVDFEGPHNV